MRLSTNSELVYPDKTANRAPAVEIYHEAGCGGCIGAGLSRIEPERWLSADDRACCARARGGGFRGARPLEHAFLGSGARGGVRALADAEPDVRGLVCRGAEELVRRWHLEDLIRTEGGNTLEGRHLEAKFSCGFVLSGRGFTDTREFGLGLTDAHREMILGWRLAEGNTGLAFGFDVKEARRGERPARPRRSTAPVSASARGWRGADRRFRAELRGCAAQCGNDDTKHGIGAKTNARR